MDYVHFRRELTNSRKAMETYLLRKNDELFARRVGN